MSTVPPQTLDKRIKTRLRALSIDLQADTYIRRVPAVSVYETLK